MTAVNQKTKKFDSGQKVGFALLIVFGILTVSLGILQMRNTIYNPFIIRPARNAGSQAFLDEAARLQQTDTDYDTLSDYEELNFFLTSSYLPDTDSDGINDNIEIEQGTDPLCPEGKKCEVELAGPTEELAPESPILENGTGADLLDLLAESALFAQDEQATSESQVSLDLEAVVKSPELLRQLLLSTGQITKEQLDQVSDEKLLELAESLK